MIIGGITSAIGGMQREVKRFETAARELAMPQTGPSPASPSETADQPVLAEPTELEASVSLPLPDVERSMTGMILASELYKANINVIEMSNEMMKSTLDMKV